MECQHSSQTSLNSFCCLLNKAAPFFIYFFVLEQQNIYKSVFAANFACTQAIIPHLSRCVYMHMLEVCILFIL